MTARLTDEQLDALERLEKAMTPGPWKCGRIYMGEGFAEWIFTTKHPERGQCNVLVAGPVDRHTPPDEAETNANGVESTRNALPALIAAARNEAVLREALERLVAAHGEGGRWHADRYAAEQRGAVRQARKALGIES